MSYVNVKITFIGGTVGREFESEIPAAEVLHVVIMQQRTVQFSEVP